MMDELAVKKQHKEIVFLLDNKRLSEALQKIEISIFDLPEWDIKKSYEEIQTSYRYMLQYMKLGIVDTERNSLYRKLLIEAYYLNDKVLIVKLSPSSFEYYYDRRRYYKQMPLRELPQLQLQLEAYIEDKTINELTPIRQQYEAALSELFYRVWLSDRWTIKEEEESHNLLNSILIRKEDLAILVSAVTMSLIQYFDIRKLMFLFDAYEHSINEVNQRAIVGIALIIFLYDNRLALYPELEARIKLLNEDERFAANLIRIQIQLLRCRETQKIGKKIQDEIVPEMLKNANLMSRKFNIEETDEESNANDKNPDWEQWMDKSGIEEKMKEMSELQMEGADVYMTMFSQLKTYPFFHNISNWFYPFDAQHSEVIQNFAPFEGKQNALLGSILQSGFFCNSDKYSFCFTIMQIPPQQRNMMSQQLEEQNEAMSEENNAKKVASYAQLPETISNQYIQDLYRFFKVHPRRHEFIDLFEESLNIYECATLRQTLGSVNNKRILAGYLFEKNYFLEALLLYEDITKETGGDAEIYQKIGYCLQKNRNYEKAIEAYLQADLRKANNVWTNQHLATCYRLLKQFDKALEYYLKVDAVKVNNLTVVTQIGLCHAEKKRYAEALSYFFKLEYLDGGSIKAWRLIAWCSFIIGKYEQAMKYYEKLLSNKPEQTDYLNAGHVAWALNNLPSAIGYYTTAVTYSTSNEDFATLFNKDREVLIEQSIPETDIPLMLDLLINMD
ncbi:MAG: hypothetical protein RRY36_03805 [Bacteroidaceae bacterium]